MQKDTLLHAVIVKELGGKSIVWFQNSNQYLLLEPRTALIVQELSTGKDINDVARQLQQELHIPNQQAMDFVQDLQQIFVLPNMKNSATNSMNDKGYLVPQSFKYIKYYKMHQRTFAVQFSNEFEVSLMHPKLAHLEVSNMNDEDHTIYVFGKKEYTFLWLDQKFIGLWGREDIHYFQGKFSMKLIESMYGKSEENWMGVFHASAVGNHENSVLILGDSGNGKSTSLALLQAHGFHCIADDFVPIDNRGKVHSFPVGISIKKPALSTLIPYYPDLEDSDEFHDERSNKRVHYLPPSHIDCYKRYACKALIFIKYDTSIDFVHKEITQLQAFKRLIPDSWISREVDNVRVFLDWFSSLPCYELIYSNNERMIEKVRNILGDSSYRNHISNR